MGFPNVIQTLFRTYTGASTQEHCFERAYIQVILVSGVVSLSLIFPLPVQGQVHRVTPDGSTDTTILGNPDCTANCTIQGTSTLGGNLFHSFSEFSIPTGVTVIFQDGGATNILSRVTGSLSQIEGTLSVTGSGNANFFLINPAGIIFGPQASLNLAGSFVGSTASHLNFADGTQFSATDHNLPALTISTPIGLQFGSSASAVINRSQASPGGATNSAGEPVGLQVNPGKTLSLVGGDILLDGGNLTALGGRIELGSTTVDSVVELTPVNQGWTLKFGDLSNLEDISIMQASIVDTSGADGTVQLQGRNIHLSEGSLITNSTLAGTSAAGPLTLTATDSIELIGIAPLGVLSGLLFSSVPGSTADGGDLILTTKRLLLQDGALISGGTGGTGDGGRLEINASESVDLIGTGLFLPSLITTSTQGFGSAGDININTSHLSLQDGAQIQSVTFGPGQGGSLIVNATESVKLNGTGSTLLAPALPSGLLASSGALSFPLPATGNSGDIQINTNILTVQNGAEVAVNSFGIGNAGKLAINAQNILLNHHGQLTAASISGAGGNIQLQNIETLNLNNNSLITTTASTGAGGILDISARSVNLDNQSQLAANTALGNGGDIRLNNVDTLKIYNSSQISASASSSTGMGAGGSLSISARVIRLDQSRLTAAATSNNGGNINLNLQETLLLRRNSQITATAEGGIGNGGNIDISTNFIVAPINEDNDIIARATFGQGGNIRISAIGIYGIEPRPAVSGNGTNDIDASSDLGTDGLITIIEPNLVPAIDNSELPILLNRSDLVAQACSVGGIANNEFTVTGRGGLPTRPEDTTEAGTTLVDLGTIAAQGIVVGNTHSVRSSPFIDEPVALIEAQGWSFNAEGKVILTAPVPDPTADSLWQPHRNC